MRRQHFRLDQVTKRFITELDFVGQFLQEEHSQKDLFLLLHQERRVEEWILSSIGAVINKCSLDHFG